MEHILKIIIEKIINSKAAACTSNFPKSSMANIFSRP
jgi:hypothetical protein